MVTKKEEMLSITLEDVVVRDEYYIGVHIKITKKIFKLLYSTLGVSECLYIKHIYRILSCVITCLELLCLVFVVQEFVNPSNFKYLNRLD